MILSIVEKLQLKDEKNILIQGIPSSIEKQFAKLSFAKNVTPLLKIRKIDFALVFAVNERQLNEILNDVIPALNDCTKFWISYPKKASKIVTDLDRDSAWQVLYNNEFKACTQVALDHVWTAMRFKRLHEPDEDETTETETPNTENFTKSKPAPGVDYDQKTVAVPDELTAMLRKNKDAVKTFDTLSFTNKREYIEWILSAKKDVTRQKRLKDTIDKLVAGKKNPSEK
jgi:hypothetical protein